MPTSVSAQTGGDGKIKLGTDEIRKLSYTYYDNASLVQYLGAVPSVISLIIQLCGPSISTTSWRQIDQPYEQCNLSIKFN